MRDPSNRSPLRRFRHVATGAPAFIVSIEDVEVTAPDSRRIALSFGLGALYAEGWSCEFSRVGRDWHLGRCVHEWEA